MKKKLFLVFFLIAAFSVHAQDTVHFTDTRQDSFYYQPYDINHYHVRYDLTAPIVVGAGAYPLCINNYEHIRLIRIPCNRTITIYGIAMSLAEDPGTSLSAWLVQRDFDNYNNTNDTVVIVSIDSTGDHYLTRFFHMAAPRHEGGVSCDFPILEMIDTTVLCYEYYFPEPVTVNGDFYIGARFNNCSSADSGVNYAAYNITIGCSLDLHDRNLFFNRYRDTSTNDNWAERWYEATGVTYPILIMAITSMPNECVVPFCGSVDSLWVIDSVMGQTNLEWTSLPCTAVYNTRYEVNYGSEKPHLDTTVITTSTTLPLTGLLPGSLAYARVRPICLFNDTTEYGPWSDSLFFLVPTDTTPCPEVHGLAASWMDTNCAYITWTPVDNLSTYQLNYAEADSLFETGTFVDCPHPYAPVCGLSTNKAYKMRVRTPCTTGMASEGYGPWSDTLLFNPQPTGINDVEHDGIRIHPNPATTQLDIVSEVTIQHVEIYNPQGKTFYEQSHPTTHLTVNLDGWPAGGYMVRIQTTDGTVMKKLIVRR